ncbi:MAG TPA: hypothetical protein VNO14_11255, partial [Blastocatellia bacterium]|nr:hypothetical protein [Blastocatellia bacterium]
LDTKRVTVDRLRRAVGLAESKAEHARNVIKAEYLRLAEGDDEKKGLRRVKMGLKALIDERAPRYGLRYVEHLLFSLDAYLTERYLQLEKALFARSTEATEILEQALGLIDEVADKPKKRFDEFKRLLQSYVQVVIEQSLLEHQLLFLKAVSKEEAIETSGGARKQTLPLIDQSIDQVKKIIKLLNDELAEQAAEAYLRDLRKEFEVKEQDVMTEYVPRLTSLLEDGSIADRLYRQVIRPEDEEARAALLREALQREDKTQAIEGLSFYLSDLYDPEKGGREPSLGMELLDRLRRFAADKLRLHPEGAREVRKPLLEVIEGLSKAEQDRLRDNFRSIRTLCPLDSARLDADMSYVAYAFADEALGRKLGLGDDDISKRWARDDDPTKIVGIILKTHVNKEGVAGLRSIEPIYKQRNRQANLPHIKKEWNDFGPREAESADAKAGALALGLACDWAVRRLLQDKPAAKTEIFSDEDPRTNRLQHVAPIFSKENSRKIYEIFGCVPEKDGRGRLMFKEFNNIKLSPSMDYNIARASLALHPELETAVEEFVEALEAIAGAETLKQYLEEYYNALDQKHRKMDRNDEQEPVIAKMLDMLEKRLNALVPNTLERPMTSEPVV